MYEVPASYKLCKDANIEGDIYLYVLSRGPGRRGELAEGRAGGGGGCCLVRAISASGGK